MPHPVIPTMSAPPVRGEDRVAFANKANTTVSEWPTVVVKTNELGDWMEGIAAAVDAAMAAAAAAQASAELAYQQTAAISATYTEIHQGSWAVPPTTRNDATALQVGDLYYSAAAGKIQEWNGMAWQDFTQTTVIALAGEVTANAAPTGAATADLVSAAVNTNGIILTGASLSLTIQGAGAAGAPYLQLLANGIVQLELILRKINSDQINSAIGGVCAIEVPAGQAVSYVANLGGSTGTFYGYVRVSWRHKA